MKALGWIIGLVALLIVAIGVYVVMNSGALLERAIETYGSRYLGAPVEVDEVTVSLSEGSAAIDGLVIDNPPGFSGEPAFRLGNVSMTLDTDQISSALIVLERVAVDGAQVNAIVQGRQTNLKKLMDHLNAEIGATGEAEETGAESEVKLIIDRFDFTNAGATVVSDLAGGGRVNVPDVHLTGIGRKSNGATVGEVLEQVLEPVYRAVTRQLIQQGVDLEGAKQRLEENVRGQAEDAVQSGLDRLRGALGGGDSDDQEQQ